jgi:hypothetical protein
MSRIRFLGHEHIHLRLPDDTVDQQKQRNINLVNLATAFHLLECPKVAASIKLFELSSAVLLVEADRVAAPGKHGKY